jgi:SNF2 family DNA or RNA helicase
VAERLFLYYFNNCNLIYTPHPYQEHAYDHVLANPYSGLFLGMGLGKTIILLNAVSELLDRGEVGKVLIIAPKRVAENTWTDEVAKWDHLTHLRLSLVLGTERQRKEGLAAKADIYIINRENVPWLVGLLCGGFPFDMLVIDELSSFKSAQAARFKALRKVRPQISRVVGLTGTPAPNGLIDLWPQMYLLDQGERLGKTITGYREAYFKEPYRRNGVPTGAYKLAGENPDNLETNENAKAITDKIKDICISMTAKDYLDLPERIDVTTPVRLPAATLQQYYDFEKEKVLEYIDALDKGASVNPANAAALSGKLLQFANGAVYVDDKGNYTEVHNEKIDALTEAVEAANGNPMLVFYSFKHDVARIGKYLKGYNPRKLETPSDMADWNAGKIQLALMHPASGGHGLNLQTGGHLIGWFGLNWSLELYQQPIGRLDRQGQVKAVVNNRLLCEGTIDYRVLSSLEGKDEGQNSLMAAVKALVKKYRG